MTQINRVEFRNVIIDGTNDTLLNIVSYSRESFKIFFSLQSVAQALNELIELYSAEEIFRLDFYQRWQELGLRCFTEFSIQTIVPINFIFSPANELFNPLPPSISETRYLNERYRRTIDRYANHLDNNNDVFCIAERQEFNTTAQFKFMEAIGFLSFISFLKVSYIRRLYKTFFNFELLNGLDIEYIYDTLFLNRRNLNTDNERILNPANVYQLTPDDTIFQPDDLTPEDKEMYISRFNRSAQMLKIFGFNIYDPQAMYISRNLRIVTQFNMDRRQIEAIFAEMPKLRLEPNARLTDEQIRLICLPPTDDERMNAIEMKMRQSLIRIHIMMQRMTNIRMRKQDITSYGEILKNNFAIDINDLIYDECVSPPADRDDIDDIMRNFETVDGKHFLVKNYTLGEVIGEVVKLYTYAQQDPNTVWMCKFIRMATNPCYSNLVNIMADFVPMFQRYFHGDFNINTINNLVIFLQGMLRPDEKNLAALKNTNSMRHLEVGNLRTFSLTRYKAHNSNPLVTFIQLILNSPRLSSGNNRSYMINMHLLNDQQKHEKLTLQDPDEQKFIDYMYDLVMSQERDTAASIQPKFDPTGERRFNLSNIDYEALVPIVSTNTFNENNISTSALEMFTGVNNQTTFFHELTNRITYRIPGIVANIIIR